MRRTNPVKLNSEKVNATTLWFIHSLIYSAYPANSAKSTIYSKQMLFLMLSEWLSLCLLVSMQTSGPSTWPCCTNTAANSIRSSRWDSPLNLLTFCVPIVALTHSSLHSDCSVTPVLHYVQKETGPLHHFWPEEESQRRCSHRCLCCKYLFIYISIHPGHPFSVLHKVYFLISYR